MNRLLTSILIGAPLLLWASQPLKIDNVEPPYWWTGMEDNSLQLMVHGDNIADCNVELEPYNAVKVDSIVKLDSPNYLLFYLNIGDDAKPGNLKFSLSRGREKYRMTYSLNPRENNKCGRAGFDAGDVLYLIMPDRFADGDCENNACASQLVNPATVDRENPNARHGGDIKGIMNHLDYIDELGVTAIWLCPVLENDMKGGSYHGYATTDYYKIDPRFGSNEIWSEFVDKAHDRGIKVVMDMIFNHTGVSHPWMTDMPSVDWYNHPNGDRMTNFRLSTLHDPYVSQYDRESTTDGWFVSAMPDLNQRNSHVLKYLIQNSIWWIETSAIDGIRMDTYPYADAASMGKWIESVEAQYPGFAIVGECWYDNSGSESFWQHKSKVNPVDPVLKTVMDFVPATRLKAAFTEQTDPWNGLNKLYDHLSLDFLYPNPQRVLTFLDNHDTDRWLAEVPDSLGQWKQALTWLLTSRGIPQIYYGTEILMSGTKAKSDGYVRCDMPGGFNGDTTSVFTAEGRTDQQAEAFDYMKKMLNWRKGGANDVIAKGRLMHFMPQHGIYVYSHKHSDREIVVLMNGNDEPKTVGMGRTVEVLPIGTKWYDVISDTPVEVLDSMTFGPRQIMILQNF